MREKWNALWNDPLGRMKLYRRFAYPAYVVAAFLILFGHWVIGLVLLAAGLFVDAKIRCPRCHKMLDSRMVKLRPETLCPWCGKPLGAQEQPDAGKEAP